jgi:UDPglucose 6-dehydrogenase
MPNVKKLLGDKIEYAANRYDALDGADALLIVTEWPVFRTPDFDFMKEKLKANVIFDGRNLYDLERMKDYGFYYNSIGRRVVS